MQVKNDIVYNNPNKTSYMTFKNKCKAIIKFPEIVVEQCENFERKRIKPDDYSMDILKVIDAIKNSRGFKRFFQRYNADNITIEDSVTEFKQQNLYGADSTSCICNYNITIHKPSLKKDYKNSDRTLWNRILDHCLPPKNITDDEYDFLNNHFDLSYSQNKIAPYRVKHTSYLQIMLELLKKRRKVIKDEESERQEEKLRKKLNL